MKELRRSERLTRKINKFKLLHNLKIYENGFSILTRTFSHPSKWGILCKTFNKLPKMNINFTTTRVVTVRYVVYNLKNNKHVGGICKFLKGSKTHYTLKTYLLFLYTYTFLHKHWQTRILDRRVMFTCVYKTFHIKYGFKDSSFNVIFTSFLT